MALHAMVTLFVWALAVVSTTPWLAPLAQHPDGSFALYGEGGRVLADVFRMQSGVVHVGLGALALALVLWALGWLSLGGTLPSLGVVEPAPALHHAMSYSLRRVPTLFGLALLALTGYVLAGVACWLGSASFLSAVARERPPFVLAPRDLVGLAVGMLLAALVTVWHDVARVVAVGRGAGTLGAAGGALRWIVCEPLETLGVAVTHAMVGWGGIALAYGASFGRGGHPTRAAVLALTVTQQFALAWRFAWRARWFYHLGRRFRERSEPSSEPS